MALLECTHDVNPQHVAARMAPMPLDIQVFNSPHLRKKRGFHNLIFREGWALTCLCDHSYMNHGGKGMPF